MRFLNILRPVSLIVAVTLFCLGLAKPVSVSAQAAGAQMTVVGNGSVRIDGVQAATGATVYAGSRITTSSGAQGVVASGGTRLTINNDSDAIVSHAGGFMRTDLVCGSITGVPAAGSPFELITHGDTSIYCQSGILKVEAEGRVVELIANQSQSFNGGVRVTTTGPAAFEASTILCSCLCAAPIVLPPVAAAFPTALLLLLIGGAAAIIVPVTVVGGDDPQVIISTVQPRR